MRYRRDQTHTRWFWREHDKESYECPECGTDEGPFDVHHKDFEVGNGAMSNLVALCEDCHNEIHKGVDTGQLSYVDGWKKGFREELMNE